MRKLAPWRMLMRIVLPIMTFCLLQKINEVGDSAKPIALNQHLPSQETVNHILLKKS